MLLGMIDFNQMPEIIKSVEDKYQQASVTGNDESCLDLKNACLNFTASYLLLILNNKQFELLKILEVN